MVNAFGKTVSSLEADLSIKDDEILELKGQLEDQHEANHELIKQVKLFQSE